jgi:hypothetical protein
VAYNLISYVQPGYLSGDLAKLERRLIAERTNAALPVERA